VFNRSVTKDVFDEVADTRDEIDAPDAPDVTDVADVAGPVEETDQTALADLADEQASPTGPQRSGGKRLARRLVAAGGVLLFVAAVALAGFFGWNVKESNDVAEAGREALATAERYAVILTSIDTGKVDENFNQVLDGATGEFKDMYSQSSTQLRQLLIDNEAVSHGTVIDAALKFATKDKAEVLIFVDQSISNRANPEPRIDRSRIGMVMERIDGQWLASKVDIK
jgi:Mce-associated membrane protein